MPDDATLVPARANRAPLPAARAEVAPPIQSEPLPADTRGADDSLPVIDAERREIIRCAACELMDWNSLIEDLLGEAAFDRVLPQILRRINTLSSVVLSAIDDVLEDNAGLSERLHGVEALQ